MHNSELYPCTILSFSRPKSYLLPKSKIPKLHGFNSLKDLKPEEYFWRDSYFGLQLNWTAKKVHSNLKILWYLSILFPYYFNSHINPICQRIVPWTYCSQCEEPRRDVISDKICVYYFSEDKRKGSTYYFSR